MRCFLFITFATPMKKSGVKILTEGSIPKLLVNLAMPLMATSFIQMAYTLTDMAWVGRLGSYEATAVGTISLLTWLMSSLAYLPKIGAEITIAQSIGANRLDKARNYASHAVMIAIIMSVVLAAVVILNSTYIVSFFKLEPYISSLSRSYLNIVTGVLPLFYLAFTFAGVYNGAGRTTIPFYIMATGLVCNIILDPLFIFGIGSIKGLGTDGAALATVLSQTIVFVLFVIKLRRPDGILDRFPFFVRLKRKYSWRIVKLGAPIALMSCSFAMISSFIARTASSYGGHLGVMSQTIGSQMEGITWNTTQGFSTALGSFTAQNFAAGKIDRTRKAYRFTLTLLLSLGIIVTLAFFFFGEEVFGIFVPETEARLAGGNYLFYAAFCQVFMMFENTTLGMWNGYGKTVPPAVISITLNLARIPLALWLAPLYGINGVWMAITISTILKGIVSPLLWKITRVK